MSIRHSDKCSKDDVQAFRNKVKKFLDENNISYSKLVALTSFGGQIKIFTGLDSHVMNLRRGIKKDERGRYYYSTFRIEKEYFTVYMEDQWEDEVSEILEWIKRKQK
jgi:quinol monooxygenase YgiN